MGGLDYRITRTTTDNLDYLRLVAMLDSELAVPDGDEHDFYDQRRPER